LVNNFKEIIKILGIIFKKWENWEIVFGKTSFNHFWEIFARKKLVVAKIDVDLPECIRVRESSNLPIATSIGSSGQPNSGTRANPSSSSSFPGKVS